MSETTENTFSGYLGQDFQTKLMWQLLVEPEFAEKVLPDIAVEYFDDPNLKRLFLIILEYLKEYGRVPNLQNKSINQAIHEFKTPGNKIEEESLFSVLKRVELWNERILNKIMIHDGDIVQKSTYFFIKQQEYRKLAETINDKTKNGDIKNKNTISYIEERFQKIGLIGNVEDNGINVFDNISNVLRKEFRQTIPTGIEFIDAVTGGGLGKGEIGLILTPSGVGKSTSLTKIANTAYEQGKNVAQIIFEDTPEQIQRKHYTIWSKIPLNEIDDRLDEANEIIRTKAEEFSKRGGNLIIKKYSQDDNITIKDIRNWLINYQKKFGIKFDILVLDYLDCVEPHKKSVDRNEGELVVIKGFESLAGDLKIPAWSALQTNRSGFNAEFIDAQQTGGNIKRIQKAHFFMSVAKTQEQKEAHLANIQILKARFAQDGQKFENCIFNNNTLEIRLEGNKYQYSQINKNIPHHDEKDIDALENMRLKFEENKSKNIELHAAISQHTENSILDIINNDNINENINNFENEKNNIPIEIKNEEIIIENIDKLLDISEEKEIEKISDVVNEGISDVVNEGINSELLEISDDKVEINDVYDLPQINSTGISVTEPHIIENRSLKDIEGLFISPDAPQGAHKEIQDKLAKLREKQNVIKKE